MAGAPTGINPAAATGLSQPTGLEALLAHPYFQAAAAGLFGALASPRSRGLSGALGIGGLGALNAFQQAERNKLQLPLLAAQIQGQQATTGEKQAAGRLHDIQASALTGQLKGDAESAAHMELLISDPSTPPAARQIYATLLPSVRSGKIGADKVFAAAQSGDLRSAQQLLTQTRTALAGEQLKELPGLTSAKEAALSTEAGATAERANIEAAKAPSQIKASEASAALSKARTADVGTTKTKTVSGVAIDKQAEAEAENAAKSYWWVSGDKREAFKQKKKAEAITRLTAAAGGTGGGAPSSAAPTGGENMSHAAAKAALPKGWKMTVNPDGSLSATDPTGQAHHWED